MKSVNLKLPQATAEFVAAVARQSGKKPETVIVVMIAIAMEYGKKAAPK